MVKTASMLENLPKDERWEKVLSRFASLETQLQDLYWEVVDCLDETDATESKNG